MYRCKLKRNGFHENVNRIHAKKIHMQSLRRGYTHSRLSLLRQTVRPRLSCGFVCVILCLAVSVEHRLVTDRR